MPLVNHSPSAIDEPAQALLQLCAGLLPVWGRHIATSRAQSEVAVGEMLKAFSDIGPHINMAERQSEQINEALAQPIAGVAGLVAACESVCAPVLADAALPGPARVAMQEVLQMVRAAVGVLEQVAQPFQHETQMVAAQVDRMYMGFQYQDRISQMMGLIEDDMARLRETLATPGLAVPALQQWLDALESRYAMTEQRQDHAGSAAPAAETNATHETTFF